MAWPSIWRLFLATPLHFFRSLAFVRGERYPEMTWKQGIPPIRQPMGWLSVFSCASQISPPFVLPQGGFSSRLILNFVFVVLG